MENYIKLKIKENINRSIRVCFILKIQGWFNI